MTDDHEQDPILDPREDERIRALLAELGTAPDASTMPPEVAARLDETLARLAAARSAAADAESESTVVPLRRRWAARATAAAAAVIVLGAGGVAAANLGLFNGSQESADSGGSTSANAESSQESPTPPAADSATGTVPALSAAGFDADVARLVRDGQLADTLDNASGLREPAEKDAKADSRRLTDCFGPVGPRVRAGVLRTPVLYDGTRAVLLVHAARGGEQLVEAWTCGGDRVLDRARVPAAKTRTGQSSPGSTGLASPSPTP